MDLEREPKLGTRNAIYECRNILCHSQFELLQRRIIVATIVHPIRPFLFFVAAALHAREPLQNVVRDSNLAEIIATLASDNAPRIPLVHDADIAARTELIY